MSLGGDLLGSSILSCVTVRQALNQHWFCEVQCRSTTDEPIPGEKALGQSCVVSHIGEDGQQHTAFAGIVIDIALKHEVWGSYGCVLRAASMSWLIDQSPRNAYFGTPSLSAIAPALGAAAGVVCSLPDKASPLEYVQFGESNWRFLLRLADDHGGWIRCGPEGTELRNVFDTATPLIFRDTDGLLAFSIAGDLSPARVMAAQYDSAANGSSTLPGEQQPAQLEAAGQGMGGAVGGAAMSAGLVGFTVRSRSWTNPDMQQAARDEAERAAGSAVVASGTSRNLDLIAGAAVTVQNLGEADGTWYLLAVDHIWNGSEYLNHFRATPWKNWRAPQRPAPAIVPGVQPARVVSNVDPAQRGRLAVSLFWQESASLLLAPMASLHGGAGFGLTVMPEVGDEVLVSFLDADPERPVILGSLWNGVHQPPAAGFSLPAETNGAEFAANDVKRLVTKSGIRIHITDTPGKQSISLATPRSNHLLLSEQVAETGRPAIALHTQGDIHLRAAGRIHRESATHSRQVDGKIMHSVAVKVMDWWGNTGAYQEITLHAQLTDGATPQVPIGPGQLFTGIPQGGNTFALPDFYNGPDIPETDE